MHTSPVRIGLIGAGSIACRRYIPSSTELDDLRIVAVCDVDASAAARAATRLGAASYMDVDEMVRREALQGVIVATPSVTHAALVAQCCALDVGVLVEKPPAVTLEEAGQVLAAIERANGLVLVGFNKRHAPAYTRARALAEHGDFRLATVHVEYSSGSWSWPGHLMSIEEAMVHHHIHGFDLIRFFAGEVTSLCSFVERRGEEQGVYVTIMRTTRGCVCTLISSSLSLFSQPFERVQLSGENRQIVVENFRDVSVALQERDPRLAYDTNYSTQDYSGNYLEGFVPQLAHFAACLRGDAEPSPSYASAYKTLVLVFATQTAARINQPVQLD